MKKRIAATLCSMILLVVNVIAFAGGAPQSVLDARQSVVRVVSETSSGVAYGSGFALGTGKSVEYIVTNNHVIEDAQNVKILLGRDNLIDATVQTALPASDLAILKLSAPVYSLKPSVINDKCAKEGTRGYALGFPGATTVLSDTFTGNMEDITITDGIVGTLQSVPWISGMAPVKVYQINAAINPGNSGGPFVNESGEVIGINSWGVEGADGINAAIRAEELTSVLNQNGIPYLKASTRNLIWLLIIVAVVVLIAAIVLLIIVLKKKNKKFKPVIYGMNGDFAGERFYLNADGVTMGRDASCSQIVFPKDSSMISRSHCNVRYDEYSGKFIITDLASSNGTYLSDGKKLTAKSPTQIDAGQKFYLGEPSNTFRVGLEG